MAYEDQRAGKLSAKTSGRNTETIASVARRKLIALYVTTSSRTRCIPSSAWSVGISSYSATDATEKQTRLSEHHSNMLSSVVGFPPQFASKFPL